MNKNTHQGLKLVNRASYAAVGMIPDKAFPGHKVSGQAPSGSQAVHLHFGPPAAVVLSAESTRAFRFVGMPPGAILLTPISAVIRRGRRPWQVHEVSRRGLPCVAALAYGSL